MQRLWLEPGIAIESVGDDLLVFVPQRAESVLCSGILAIAVRRIQSGESGQIDEESLAQLVEMGIVSPTLSLSRRGLLKSGALGLGAGVAALAMPSVAVASSDVCQTGLAVTSATYWIDGSTVYFTVAYVIPADPTYSLGNLRINGAQYEASADFGAPSSSPAESTWVYVGPIPEADEILEGQTWAVCANFFVNPESAPQVVYRVDGFQRVVPSPP